MAVFNRTIVAVFNRTIVAVFNRTIAAVLMSEVKATVGPGVPKLSWAYLKDLSEL